MEQIVAKLLTQFEEGRISRRELVRSLTAGVAVASSGALAATPKASPFKAVGINHISYGVADYARTRDFYADLLGMEASDDNGKQCFLSFGEASYLVVRKTRQPDGKPFVDHVAYAIDHWDAHAVEAELRGRGFDPRPDSDQSFHIKDPDGFDVQVTANDWVPDPLKKKK